MAELWNGLREHAPGIMTVALVWIAFILTSIAVDIAAIRRAMYGKMAQDVDQIRHLLEREFWRREND